MRALPAKYPTNDTCSLPPSCRHSHGIATVALPLAALMATLTTVPLPANTASAEVVAFHSSSNSTDSWSAPTFFAMARSLNG